MFIKSKSLDKSMVSRFGTSHKIFLRDSPRSLTGTLFGSVFVPVRERGLYLNLASDIAGSSQIRYFENVRSKYDLLFYVPK